MRSSSLISDGSDGARAEGRRRTTFPLHRLHAEASKRYAAAHLHRSTPARDLPPGAWRRAARVPGTGAGTKQQTGHGGASLACPTPPHHRTYTPHYPTFSWRFASALTITAGSCSVTFPSSSPRNLGTHARTANANPLASLIRIHHRQLPTFGETLAGVAFTIRVGPYADQRSRFSRS